MSIIKPVKLKIPDPTETLNKEDSEQYTEVEKMIHSLPYRAST